MLNQPEWYPQLLEWLEPIKIHTRRLVFDFRSARQKPQDIAVATIRGIWGRALRSIHEDLYQRVFEGLGGAVNRQPLYLVREDLNVAGCSYRLRDCEMSVQWTTLNIPEFMDKLLIQAWDVAGMYGLGPQRMPFRVTQIETLSRELLDPAFVDACQACSIVFPLPLRLIQHNELLTQPTVPDLVRAILNRLGFLHAIAVSENPFELQLPARVSTLWPEFAGEILDFAKTVEATPWQGLPRSLRRYSGRQKCVVRLSGIAGMLQFPQGVSLLAPLFAAASTVHVGKGTVYGMGRPFLLPE